MMFTTRPEILGTFGVVTSTHWLASAAGMSLLERGGNAFDACVASASCCRWSSLTWSARRRDAGRVLFGPHGQG